MKTVTLTKSQQQTTQRVKALWEAKRQMLHLTQEKAAHEVGVSQPTIHQYINGELPIGTDAVLAFAKLLRVSVREIDPDIADRIEEFDNRFVRLSRSEDDLLVKVRQLPWQKRMVLTNLIESMM